MTWNNKELDSTKKNQIVFGTPRRRENENKLTTNNLMGGDETSKELGRK